MSTKKPAIKKPANKKPVNKKPKSVIVEPIKENNNDVSVPLTETPKIVKKKKQTKRKPIKKETSFFGFTLW